MSTVVAIVLFLLAIGIVFMILAFLLKALKSGKPGKKRLNSDLDNINNLLLEDREEFLPWSQEDLKILSPKTEIEKIKYKGHKYCKGIIRSIYHEPMVKFAYKKYNNLTYVLLARTSDKKITYVNKDEEEEVRVYVNGEPYGWITVNHKLLSADRSEILGHKEVMAGKVLQPVIIGEKEVGMIPHRSGEEVNPRAYSLLKKMTPKEETAFAVLTFYNIIQEQITKK